ENAILFHCGFRRDHGFFLPPGSRQSYSWRLCHRTSSRWWQLRNCLRPLSFQFRSDVGAVSSNR
ncbi:hypothetical protein BT69DRAFT_1351912, partial [Atractiella rhizophila]